ncbi:hypothetical protein V8G54_016377 [Vigna mungo]|uniref:Uncharacterized protein n=1 Tax=Vigna mungo TaxID=3915 RepID=A0AAQ3NM98_VIGMU
MEFENCGEDTKVKVFVPTQLKYGIWFYEKGKKGKALKITSANRVFPTPSLPQENEPVDVPLQPNTPRHHSRLTYAPSLPCASPPRLLFLHFPFSLLKHRVNRSFPTQIRRIGARLAVPALEALGLGLPSDVVCSWH